MIKYHLISGLVLACGLLSSCVNSSDSEAPVTDRSLINRPMPGHYRVQAEDTLYTIAWLYQLDYQKLAAINRLKPPYFIHPGQLLRLTFATTSIEPAKAMVFTKSRGHFHWLWPARGRVVGTFSQKAFASKGISIAGHLGEPVVAATDGIVVYSGAGVRGYGNLIIIKHDQNYLSAYAFNQRNDVREGSKVVAGQKVADMGQDNSGHVLLYFEIRQNGKPVDPIPYLR